MDKKLFVGIVLASILVMMSTVVSALPGNTVCQIYNQQDQGRKLQSVNGNASVDACCLQSYSNPDYGCTCFGANITQNADGSCRKTLVQNILNRNNCWATGKIIDFAGCGLATKGCGYLVGSIGDRTECKRNDAGTGNVDQLVVSNAQKFTNLTTNETIPEVALFYETGTVVVQEDSGTTLIIDGKTYYAKLTDPTDPSAPEINAFVTLTEPLVRSRTSSSSTTGAASIVSTTTSSSMSDAQKIGYGLIALLVIGGIWVMVAMKKGK
jgi:hypothetical protein